MAKFYPQEGDSEGQIEVEGCKVQRVRDPDGTIRRGQFEIELPPGTGAHEIQIQLLGSEPRRYSLKDIDPMSHELRTFRYLDTPTMMEDTGFEMIVSVKTLGD